MDSIAKNKSKQTDQIIFPLLASLVIVLFLFFIDEGYYDFRWMRAVGNWIVFFMYLAVIYPILWLTTRLLFSK